MSFQIKDGHGKGYLAKVNKLGELSVEASTRERSAEVSIDDGLTFNAVFEDASAAAGDYVAYIKNISTTRNLFIEIIRLSAANAATWKVVTATGTATGGNTVTPVSMNRGLNITAEVTALADDVGGFTAGSALIAMNRTPATTSSIIPFNDRLILGTGDAIALEYDAGTTGIASSTIAFYFRDK